MTREDAVKLEKGTWIHHISRNQGKGQALRVRVNGQVRTWKRDKARIEVPVKWGMWECATLTADDLEEWEIGYSR